MATATATATPTDFDELMNKPLWDIRDVTTFCGVSHDTLLAWRKSGSFPEPRVMPGGRLIRWGRDEVLDWFDRLERAAA